MNVPNLITEVRYRFVLSVPNSWMTEQLNKSLSNFFLCCQQCCGLPKPDIHIINKHWKGFCISHTLMMISKEAGSHSILCGNVVYSGSYLCRNCYLCLLRWIPLCMIVKKIVNVARTPWFSATDRRLLITFMCFLIKTFTVAAVRQSRIEFMWLKTSFQGVCVHDLVPEERNWICVKNALYLETSNGRGTSLQQDQGWLSLMEEIC